MRPFKTLLLLCFMALVLPSIAQNNYTVSGYVKDELTGEGMIGANVYIKELLKGTSTNPYGFYSITVAEGNYTLVVSYLGYQDYEFPIELTQDIRHNMGLKSKAILTKEVEITGERTDRNTESTDMGRVELEVEKIKALPAFLGEVDILKTIQFLPGVQSAGEGNSGFYVRGGGPDQNLILLDEAVVYNASHLFGFFSVFNADAVKNIELIKGGMPANYGGRLASVLNISMNDGNYRDYKVDGGIGLISSRATVQGPIKKDTSSFIISGRRTYIDVLMKPFINKESAFNGSGYYFYDLNAKFNYRISDKDRLFLSGYFGRDKFSFNNEDSGFRIDIPWGNATGSLRWNHLFNDKLFMNTTAIYSDYRFEFAAEQSQFEFRLFSGIKDWNLKSDFSYFPNIRHNIKFGYNYTYHTFIPSNATARSGEVEFDTGGIKKLYANEGAVYVMDNFDITDQLKINAGMRFSLFNQIGPFDRFIKDGFDHIVDTISYGRAETVETYTGWEPRISLRYKLNTTSSVKAAYTQNYQYIHLASISSVSLPTDVWLPSTDVVQPQYGVQYNIGYFRNFKDDTYETSVELYYKEMDNLVEYAEGAQPEDGVNDNVDAPLTFGDGYSYGAEFFFKKRTGKTTGWIGYTWSKTMRTFEFLNGGEEFAAKYDRRHDLSIVATHEFNENWTFGGAFVYATGNTITLPVARYFIEGQIVNEYGARNGFRMSPYHRADISATYSKQKFKTRINPDTGEEEKVAKRLQSSWSFAVYNLYNRANPYFIYFDNNGDFFNNSFQVVAKQVSLFPVLPSVTWNFSF